MNAGLPESLFFSLPRACAYGIALPEDEDGGTAANQTDVGYGEQDLNAHCEKNPQQGHFLIA